MKLTDKNTITSNTEPKMTNVTWLDVSGELPVMRKYINGSWRPVGGGGAGGSLPTPTAEDEGKVMQVVKEKIGENVIETVYVPEQTCNMEDDGKSTICTLQNVNEDFRAGFIGIVILDGSEYSVEWLENHSGFAITESVGISLRDGSPYLWDADKGLTHTIKVITRETEPVYEYSWEPVLFEKVVTADPSTTSIKSRQIYDFGNINTSSFQIPTLNVDGSDEQYQYWTILFNAQTDISNFSTADNNVIWQNGDTPSPETGHHYEISITTNGDNYYATYMDFYSE